jgi:hypothetical protein
MTDPRICLGGGVKFDKGFTKLAFKRVAYAKHTINKNPFVYPLVFHIKRVRNFSFLLWVRVNIIAGINLVGLLLICVVIHGAGMAIKVCVSNYKIDFCNGADYDTKIHHVQ